MKKINAMMAGVVFIYGFLSVMLFFLSGEEREEANLQYKVEINEIMNGLEEEGEFSKPDLQEKKYIKGVTFLPQEETAEEEIASFYKDKNKISSSVVPLFSGEKLLGYVRFDYISYPEKTNAVWIAEGILTLFFLFMTGFFVYIKGRIIKPFQMLSDMPYELAKGHLKGELEESRNRFFGKFVWGISMLRDTLNDSKNKELKLEKEKKLLLLSISHDIKIPLSAIKLYAKALREGLYDTEEKCVNAAGQIEVHAGEIEAFVKEIVTTSKEDILAIEVENSEFYIKDYMEKVKACYAPKCSLRMTDFFIGKYENKLLKGDRERAFEVMENLLENAFKYGDGKQILIEFYEEDYCQIISVFNTGTPIGADEMPHIFDSFYRGSNVGKKEGNGLGLYICRQIMKKMEGDIFAVREAKGMRFCLVFRM